MRWDSNVEYCSSSDVTDLLPLNKAHSDHGPITPDDLLKDVVVFYSVSPLSGIIMP